MIEKLNWIKNKLKQNKLTVMLVCLCLFLLLTSLYTTYQYLYYKNSASIYKARLQDKEQYSIQLEADIHNLKKDKFVSEFDIKSAKPDNSISKNINLINPYDYIPQRRYVEYNYPQPQTERIIYVENDNREDIFAKQDREREKEIEERRLMEAESKINNLELERDIRIFGLY